MSDRENRTPLPEPPEIAVPDPEADHPLREAFARYLDPEDLAELVPQLRDRYTQRLQETGLQPPPGVSGTADRLRAVAVDLRRVADVLAASVAEREDALADRDFVLSILAGPRRLEVLAVVERIDRMLAHEPTPMHPVPPDCQVAGMVPDAELERIGRRYGSGGEPEVDDGR